MKEARIVIGDPDTGPRKVTKLISLADGGLAIAAPYHSSHQGFLMKHSVDYSKRTMLIPIEDVTSYTASDRVKLSLHIDGFTQFSGESPGRIVSGREQTGKPKGLGIQVNPLTQPLSTGGPTFALVLWGLADFAPGQDTKNAVIFEEGDFNTRHETQGPVPYYFVEGFIYPRSFLADTHLQPGRMLLRRRFPNYEGNITESGIIVPPATPLGVGPGETFDLRVVDLEGMAMLIALLVSRASGHEMDSPSGFTMHSPSDMNQALAAFYPNLGREGQSLDYSPTRVVFC